MSCPNKDCSIFITFKTNIFKSLLSDPSTHKHSSPSNSTPLHSTTPSTPKHKTPIHATSQHSTTPISTPTPPTPGKTFFSNIIYYHL